MEPKIKIQDYTYILPEERIAKYPLPNRDDSKILIYADKNISESKFSNLDELLPQGALLVFNNTRVVPARLIFRKESGALIEIFCLEPVDPVEYNTSFASIGSCSWLCVVGNVKRWKEGYIFFNDEQNKTGFINLKAKLLGKREDKFEIKFEWNGDIPFSEVMDLCGKIPIPPYLKRDTENSDIERYQTVYAINKGSVAAPTAGLHFTDKLLSKIKLKNIEEEELCLHVGAGTFLPVKSEYISDHTMHFEPFSIKRSLLVKLINSIGKRKIISVGTTSTRSLESLYYLGVHCIEKGEPGIVKQWEPYNQANEYTSTEALYALLNWLNENKIEEYCARTQIIIAPSYKFRIVDCLITNFHQPQSTLLLLISAFIGEDWRKVYNYALDNDFRFLSYGDSSLLIRPIVK